MTRRQFVSLIHQSTTRDYLARVNAIDKAHASEIACKFGRDYWDGDRLTGYGGYTYDGRWRAVAAALVDAYSLKPGMRVLDVGCGKGFLLYDLSSLVPGLDVTGVDISSYAIENAHPDIRDRCQVAAAQSLPFGDREFDLVLSINTLHNLYNFDLVPALQAIERVSRRDKYICVEAYRSEREKVNLMYWQLTCRIFHTPEEWEYEFKSASYQGDSEFIFFE